MTMISSSALATATLSKDDLRKLAPKAFRTTPSNPNVTDRYVVASTEQVVDDLASMGWLPVIACQPKVRKESSIRSYHMIAFQNPDICIAKGYIYVDKDGNEYKETDLIRTAVRFGRTYGYRYNNGNEICFEVRQSKVVEAYPRIILTNSYDGFNAFTFRCGLFRLVCSNGLVVCTNSFTDVSVRHTKYNIAVLNEIVCKAITAVDEQIGTMNEMQSVTLTEEQKTELAISAVRIRQGLNEDEKCTLDEDGIKDLLTPLRKEDEGNSLWNVFNVLQEKITKGGASVAINGKKVRKMRGIKSFAKDIDINQNLYRTALAYLEINEVSVETAVAVETE